MKSILFCFSIFLFSSSSFAAIPSKTTSKKLLAKDIDAALMALQLPVNSRTQALKSQQAGVQVLKGIVRNDDQPLTVRWRAMTSLGRVYPKESLEFLTTMTMSSQWFHRNSALLSLKLASPKIAVQMAEKLLNDPALVVRTAAVQTLSDLNARQSRMKLWSELSSKVNFHKGKSLWVRQHIMKTLAVFAQKEDRNRFASYLNDKDPKVQLWAIDGLEKVTGTKLNYKGLSFADRRNKWISWASDNGVQTSL